MEEWKEVWATLFRCGWHYMTYSLHSGYEFPTFQMPTHRLELCKNFSLDPYDFDGLNYDYFLSKKAVLDHVKENPAKLKSENYHYCSDDGNMYFSELENPLEE